jgi:hypothetical protein
MCTNRHLFRQTGLQKMRESQKLFFKEQHVSIIFEEYQQPAIQTKIVSCPQNWERGLKKANRYPNPKRGAPAVFMKLNMRFQFAEIQTMCLSRDSTFMHISSGQTVPLTKT